MIIALNISCGFLCMRRVQHTTCHFVNKQLLSVHESLRVTAHAILSVMGHQTYSGPPGPHWGIIIGCVAGLVFAIGWIVVLTS